MFESIVSKIINPHFKNIIIEEQQGFMSDRSTATNFLRFQHFILDPFKLGHRVNVVFTDFSKAFDTIQHNILPIKLKCLGSRNPFFSLLLSFIINRKQYV